MPTVSQLQDRPRLRHATKEAVFYLAVGPEYSCSLWQIDMVKAVDDREFNNVAGFP
jgi:hypothetical protein